MLLLINKLLIINDPLEQSAKERESKIRKEIKDWEVVVLRKLEKEAYVYRRGRKEIKEEKFWRKNRDG